MAHYLSDDELKRLKLAQEAAFRPPVPTQMISNGEFNPLPQTEDQKKVESRLKELADELGKPHGMDRRQFLATSSGMAAAFLAMNEVFGSLFDVSRAEAAQLEMAQARADGFANQFILDNQTHFVHDGFAQEGLLGIGAFAAENWNPALTKDQLTLSYYKFENYVRQMFFNSDTKVAVLSGAPFDDPSWILLPNDQIKQAVEMINGIAESRRMLGHFVFTPGQDGWMDEVDRAIAEVHPDSWKGYTIGDPLSAATKYPWRLDDEALLYPMYEKIVQAGITNICIHKGLMPADYETSWPNVWQYQTPRDIVKAAKDWPQINFIIYHSCLRPFLELPDQALAEFEATGEITWSSDLARLPGEHGVSNVYGELGTSFALTATTSPRFAAALLGTLIKGMGADHVVWGSDSVFYGSPQWQIEAFRRLEIPAEMQNKHGFAPLGAADGMVKNAIFGYNSARLYDLNLRADYGPMEIDKFAEIKREYELAGGLRDNATYGYVNVG